MFWLHVQLEMHIPLFFVKKIICCRTPCKCDKTTQNGNKTEKLL